MVLVQGGLAYILSRQSWDEFRDLSVAGLRPDASDYGALFGHAVTVVDWMHEGMPDPAVGQDGSDLVILDGYSATSYTPCPFEGDEPEAVSLGRYEDADRLAADLDAVLALPVIFPFEQNQDWHKAPRNQVRPR